MPPHRLALAAPLAAPPLTSPAPPCTAGSPQRKKTQGDSLSVKDQRCLTGASPTGPAPPCWPPHGAHPTEYSAMHDAGRGRASAVPRRQRRSAAAASGGTWRRPARSPDRRRLGMQQPGMSTTCKTVASQRCTPTRHPLCSGESPKSVQEAPAAAAPGEPMDLNTAIQVPLALHLYCTAFQSAAALTALVVVFISFGSWLTCRHASPPAAAVLLTRPCPPSLPTANPIARW